MSSVQDHYDNQLGRIYAWTVGGADAASQCASVELDALGITASSGGTAVDLGAGFGAHAIPLARRGFQVTAIDSCGYLLGQLRARKGALPINLVQADLRLFPQHLVRKPQVILCMGDTLTHLPDERSVGALMASVANTLARGGRFIATFRDYSHRLIGADRFIAVRSDDTKVLTCCLEYSDAYVTVHDLLYERDAGGWKLNVDSYRKLCIEPDWVVAQLRKCGLIADKPANRSGMACVVARRVA